MKKEYIIPKTETVHLNLTGSILENFPINSGHSDRQGAKGNSNLYEEEEDEDNASDTNDAWE
jgi:hypothetical protein